MTADSRSADALANESAHIFSRRGLGKRLLGASALAALLIADRYDAALAAPILVPSAANVAVGTAFTYDGILLLSGNPANGTYDFEFRLFDAASAGVQVGSPLAIGNVVVRDGHYRVELDFGSSAFTGSARWLQIGVRGGTSTGAYTTLPPRTLLTLSPYALYASRIPLSGNGKSARAARSDHNHFGAIWTGVTSFDGGGLMVTDTSTQRGFGLIGVQSTRSSWVPGASGVWGDSADRLGVSGTSSTGTGVAGTSSSGVGVSGWSSGGHGVTGSNPSYTLAATGAAGVFGRSEASNGNGLIGEANNGGSAYAIWGRSTSGYAGYFSGKVHVAGTMSKAAGSFKIDHPLDPANRYLSHSFVESPDMMNVYNGNATLDANGEATVPLPTYFEALNRDFRYQLTAIGAPGPELYVAEEIAGNRFRIAGGKAGLKVSWQVTGIRQDAFANAHRIPVEEAKPTPERGTYLHPKEHGKPDSLGVDSQRSQQLHENNRPPGPLTEPRRAKEGSSA